MHDKLTLRIEAPLIKAAKKYSKSHGKSLSKLIADYLYLLTEEGLINYHVDHVPPLTKSLQGILRTKKVDEVDYRNHLKDKYK